MLPNSADFTETVCAVMKGLRMRLVVNEQISKSCQCWKFYLDFVCHHSRFWQPVHVDSSGFQKPYCYSPSGFLTPLTDRFELQNLSGFWQNQANYNVFILFKCNKKFIYFQGKLDKTKFKYKNHKRPQTKYRTDWNSYSVKIKYSISRDCPSSTHAQGNKLEGFYASLH
jgi:hypothetical protein